MEEDFVPFHTIGMLEPSDDGGLVIRISAEVVAERKLKAGERMGLHRREWFLDDPTHPYYDDPNENRLEGMTPEKMAAIMEASSACVEDFVNG